jgi:2-isopropylmalate synthase
VFDSEYLKAIIPVEFLSHTTVPDAHASEVRHLTATVRKDGAEITIKGTGTGPIDAYCSALQSLFGIEIDLLSYSEQATGRGQNTQAVAYIELKTAEGTIWGVGADRNIVAAALKAVTSAVNRLLKA